MLAGLLAFACLPFLSVYLGREPASLAYDASRVACVSILAALVVVAHRRNFVEEFSHLLERRSMPKQHPPEP